jgi:hypothetical protein
MNFDRLNHYLREANNHIERLESILFRLNKLYPIDTERFKNLDFYQQNLIDALIFRFSKLQDLIGSKIFREYLETIGFSTEGKSFLEILKEIEKEGIIDIDTWSEFRKVRNLIAHDYPDEIEDKVDAINYLIKQTPILIGVIRKIESKINR